MNANRQQGVALLTVLLLVAVMTVLVVAVLDDIRFGLRSTGNSQSSAQAQWYALAAESMAAQRIRTLSAASPGITTLAGDWDGQPTLLPIEDGEQGSVRLQVDDGSRCFNLNSVVEGATEQWQRSDVGARQFAALLQALEIPASQSARMVDSLVDWIDSDQQPGQQGAEDATYLGRAPAYRSSGALLAEVSELRAINGFDAASYALIRDYVCALPDAQLAPVNVNTLRTQHAPLLAMLGLGTLALADARAVIAARPPQGWRSVADFLDQPVLVKANLPNPVMEQLQLRTRYFRLQAQVEYGSAQSVLSSLLELQADNRIALVSHRWTLEE